MTKTTESLTDAAALKVVDAFLDLVGSARRALVSPAKRDRRGKSIDMVGITRTVDATLGDGLTAEIMVRVYRVPSEAS